MENKQLEKSLGVAAALSTVVGMVSVVEYSLNLKLFTL